MPFRGTTQHRRERVRGEQDQEEGSARWRRRDGQGKRKTETIERKKGKESREGKERERGRDDQESTAGKLTIGGRNVAETDVSGNTRLFTRTSNGTHPQLDE